MAALLLATLGGAVAATVAVRPLLDPERLRAEAEARLSEALGSPVEVGSVQLTLGVGIHLEARDMRLWPGTKGPALEVERVAVGLEPFSLLTGTLRPRQMVLEDARFDIERDAGGTWSDPFGFANRPRDRGAGEPTEPLLRPLRAVDGAIRFLLDRPYLADSLRVRNAVVSLRMARGPGGSPPLALSLDIDEGSLRHSRLRGDARLELSGRLHDTVRDLGPVTWRAVRDRHGGIESELELGGLDAESFQDALRTWDDRALLGGRVHGTVAIESRPGGHTAFDADLAIDTFNARLRDEESELGTLSADRADLDLELEVAADSLTVQQLRVRAGELGVELSGRIGRPLSVTSAARLGVSLYEIELGKLRRLLEWLPVRQREPLEGTVTAVESGRLVRFETRGAASLGAWQEFFSGSRAPLSMGLEGRLEVADVVARIGESDRIERLGLEARWSGDQLEVADARGTLNESPLPAMHLSLDGLSHLIAAAPERRQIRAGALPLPGVELLREVLSPDDTPDEELTSAVMSVDVDVLEHPIFVWPLERLHAIVETDREGARVSLSEGTWAGVPISGEAAWRFEPDPELRFTLVAGPPEETGAPSLSDSSWARGSFVVGPVRTERWRHAGATGTFRARAGTVRLENLEVALDPNGLLRGNVSLDLSRQHAVPYQANLSLIGGDVSAIGRQLGLSPGLATGFLSAWTSVDGTLRRDAHFADLSGLVEVEATQGRIWRKIPAIAAVALASSQLDSFSARDSVRYESVKTLLELDEGRMHTDSFWLDGPDLRVFAEGQVDLVSPTHKVDADLAIFLFRQLDRALDKIPILNVLLLGTKENLVAAHFKLSGPWSDPQSRLVPLKSLAAGPASLVLEGLPNIVARGLRALGAMFEDEDTDAADALTPGPRDGWERGAPPQQGEEQGQPASPAAS